MRIGIDARFLTHPQRGGFKTYTEHLVCALADEDAHNEYVLYVDRAPIPDEWPQLGLNFRVRVVSGALPAIGMPWREQVGLVGAVAQDRLDMLHAPCLTAPLQASCPTIVTIHDTIWMFPEQFAGTNGKTPRRNLMTWYYRLVPQLAAEQAQVVITVSQHARSTILEHLNVRPERIVVTPEAASPRFRQVDDPAAAAVVRATYGLGEQFILAIGSADPRKNLGTLLHAYARLPADLRAQYELAIVWTHRLLAEQIDTQARMLGIRERLRFLERVSDADLLHLYNNAVLFVFPSLYEGFGLPPLEAMACGAPVIAANNSSLPEIVGEAGLLFDAQDAVEIAQKMTQALRTPALRAELSARGLERAASFSWQRCARETLRAYEMAALPA